MKTYYGRRVRIYKYSNNCDDCVEIVPTCETGRLLEIDVHNGHVMVEDGGGNMVKLFYKLVKLI